MNDLSIRDVVRNPEWLPHAFDPDGQELTFVHLPRAARSELMFLFDQHFAGRFTKLSFPTAAVSQAAATELVSAAQAPINFIFHTSFCGSTLLAKALEVSGVASSMREPAIFTSLANRVSQRDGRAVSDRLELVLRLLERPLAPGESVIAKQTSFANRLADHVLKARDMTRSVLLYSDLETYLVALLKRGMWGRIWGRKLFSNLRSWSTLNLDLDPDEILELTDMQAASLAWLMQIHHFDALAKEFGSRIMLLKSSQMFGAPAATLHQVMTFFDLGLNEVNATNIAAGPIFAKHSKFSDRDYSVEERRRDTEIVSKANSEEISMVVKWLESYVGHHGLSLRPSGV